MEIDSQPFFVKLLNFLTFHKHKDTSSTFAKGRSGEKKASFYLKKKGLKIIEHNFRWYGNEIDIIAKDKDGLVFVEVKSSNSPEFDHPLSWISAKKQKCIIKASNGYIVSHGLTESMVRFDVVAIEPDGKINHIVDAFRP